MPVTFVRHHEVARPLSDNVHAYVLGANTRQAIAVPPGANFAVFSTDGCNIYVKPNDGSSLVTLPVANMTDGSAGELNPLMITLANVQTIGVISPEGGVLSVAWFA
jgi:hypothetical protein